MMTIFMALWATVIGYFRIFSPTIRTFLVCTNVNLPIFRIFSRKFEPQSGHFLRNGKILIFFSLCLISRTNFSYPLQYPLRKVDSFVDPKRLLRATFPFSVSSGVTSDGFTKSNSCFPLADTLKPLLVRSINSDLISFSMISARVAGVPKLCFSIFLTTFLRLMVLVATLILC